MSSLFAVQHLKNILILCIATNGHNCPLNAPREIVILVKSNMYKLGRNQIFLFTLFSLKIPFSVFVYNVSIFFLPKMDLMHRLL